MAADVDIAHPPETSVPETRVPHFSRVLGASKPALSLLKSGDSRHSENETVPCADSHATDKARRERRRALIFPREHGAWGLLLVPMVTGAGVAFRESAHVAPILLLLTAALTLFWLRTPLESLLGTSAMRAQTKDERREVTVVIAGLSLVATTALVMLFWSGKNPYLWLIGAAAGTAFAGQGLLKHMWRQPPRLSRQGGARRQLNPQSTHHTQSTHRFRMLSEIVGTIGLTSSAPAAYYVMTGKFGAIAWMLWLANLIFAGNQIHYVQLRIHTVRIEGLRAKLARGWSFAAGQAVMTAALTIASFFALIPQFMSLAFAPLLFRGWYYFIQKPSPFQARKLGWSELAHAVVFCILFVAAI